MTNLDTNPNRIPQVLLVEDEAVLRMTFAEFLEAEQYEVYAAESYDDAVTYLENGECDLIITDIIMAGKTGLDLLRTVRERDMQCPVIMITGEPNVETASEAVRLGAFDYLGKPVTRDALKRVARLALEHHNLRVERDHYAAQTDRYRRELEAIFNSVNEGIITVDAKMSIRQMNASAAEILGVPVNSAGQPFAEAFPRGLEQAESALEETLRAQTRIVDRRIELAIPGHDERVIIVSTDPLVNEAGVFIGAVLMIRDVTRMTRLERQIEETLQYRDMVGKSAKMQTIFGLIKDLAETDTTVLVYGESGTGKELVAAALHHSSARENGPFLKVNCAALSENILESELFGHVKGAFTGAVKDHRGRFESANGGTILLDEIGDISPRLQLRLLRVLQEREFERVGSSKPIRTDVRVIASTNQNLEEKIRVGEFRQDLYYRLNVVRIEIPPLRERREDVPLLVERFVKRFNGTLKREIAGVSPEAMELLMRYQWPGNVRELENCIERSFIVCHDSVLLPKHLPHEIAQTKSPSFPHGLSTHPEAGGESERDRIVGALDRTDWNIAKSSRLLGVARNTLYQKMKALHISRPNN